MRGLLLDAIILAFCLAALFRAARLGLFGYVWFALLRPDVLAWVYARYPYSQSLAIATTLAAIPHYRRLHRLVMNPITAGALLLFLSFTVSTMDAVVPDLSWPALEYFARAIWMALLIPILITSERHLRTLVLIMAASLGFLGLKWGVWGVIRGGVHFTQGYGGMLSGSNEIALAMAMVMPLCWYARRLDVPRWAQWIFIAMTFGSIATVIMTYSRGGALALTAALLVIILREKRRLMVLVAMVILVGPTVYLIHDSYMARLETIQNPEEESSAASRIVYARAAFAMWQDYPILGVGFGQLNYVALEEPYLGYNPGQVVHNSYMQVLVDNGIGSFAIFVILMAGTQVWLTIAAHRVRHSNSRMKHHVLALQAALAAYMVGCTFGSRETYDFYYVLLMSAAACYEVLRENPDGEDPAESEPETSGDDVESAPDQVLA